MTTQQARSLALLVLTTLALGSLTSVATVAEPAANKESKTETKASAADPATSSPAASSEKTESSPPPPVPVDPPQKVLVSGRVVLLSDALQRRKIKTYLEESKGQMVLETDEGDLLPIISDWRGRAFYQDKRLRDRKVTLLAHRRKHIPHLQVLSIFTYDGEGHTQLTDYWCDICSIPMYEIKKCECCQGPNRLRFQKKDLPNPADEPVGKK
jgi:hypothetical protein